MKKKPGSWEGVHRWYDDIVGKKGHTYHRTVILPKLKEKIAQHKPLSVLDLACGQGVLSRTLSSSISYTGVDLSKSLVKKAAEQANNHQQFFCSDVTKPIPALGTKTYDLITVILAVQDMQKIEGLFANFAKHLSPKGKAYLVLNHPCFRIPKSSHWLVDEEKDLQSRQLDAYLGKQSIPIQVAPSQGQASPTVTTYHRPLHFFIKQMRTQNLCVTDMEEWVSPKKSTGRCAKRENKARREFPLFLFLEVQKL